MVGYFRCTHTVEMKRGGEVIGQAGFVTGKTYQCIHMQGNDYVFINEGGGTHIIPADFLKKNFEPDNKTGM